MRKQCRYTSLQGLNMFASTKSKAAAVALLALVIIPAPLLPPLGLTGKGQSILGVSGKTAYLAAASGLHMVLYGALGVVAACAVWARAPAGGRLGDTRGTDAVSRKGRLNYLYSPVLSGVLISPEGKGMTVAPVIRTVARRDEARWLVFMGGVVLEHLGASGRSPPRG
jgi:hypothetical protein